MNRLTMTAAEREAFLCRPRSAILSVAEADGGVLGAPVWYLFRPPETFLVMLEPASRRASLIKDVGRATLTVQDEGDLRGSGRPLRYVSATGRARFSDSEMTAQEFEDYWAAYLPGVLRDRYFALGGDRYLSEVTTPDDAESIEGVLVITTDRWLSRDYAKAGARWDAMVGVPGASEIA